MILRYRLGQSVALSAIPQGKLTEKFKLMKSAHLGSLRLYMIESGSGDTFLKGVTAIALKKSGRADSRTKFKVNSCPPRFFSQIGDTFTFPRDVTA